MIRVLHLAWGLETGGKERLVDRLVRGLDGRRFASSVLTLRARGEIFEGLLRDGYGAVHIGKRPGLDPGAARRLRRELERLAPDVVHAHEFTSLAAAVLARGRRPSPPLVTTLHGGHLDLGLMKRLLFRFLVRRAASVTAVSGPLAAEARRLAGGMIPTLLIPPGIDAAPLQREVARQERLRDMGAAPAGPHVVWVGRLAPPKDPDTFLLAAEEVLRSLPAARFLVVGDGPRRADLEEWCRGRGLLGPVAFLGERREIPWILGLADVCALASRREGVPLAVLEYLAARRPVVATDVGGVGDLVRDGEEGYLVPAGDWRGMAGRILHLLSHPEEAKAMGRRGGERARERFSLEGMLRAYGDLYERAAGGAA